MRWCEENVWRRDQEHFLTLSCPWKLQKKKKKKHCAYCLIVPPEGTGAGISFIDLILKLKEGLFGVFFYPKTSSTFSPFVTRCGCVSRFIVRSNADFLFVFSFRSLSRFFFLLLFLVVLSVFVVVFVCRLRPLSCLQLALWVSTHRMSTPLHECPRLSSLSSRSRPKLAAFQVSP